MCTCIRTCTSTLYRTHFPCQTLSAQSQPALTMTLPLESAEQLLTNRWCPFMTLILQHRQRERTSSNITINSVDACDHYVTKSPHSLTSRTCTYRCPSLRLHRLMVLSALELHSLSSPTKHTPVMASEWPHSSLTWIQDRARLMSLHVHVDYHDHVNASL